MKRFILVKLYFVLDKYKVLILILIRVVFYWSFFDFCCEDSITMCIPDKPFGNDRTPASSISEMEELTKKDLARSTRSAKIARRAFIDPDNRECETLCRELSRWGVNADEACNTACGKNSKEIIDQLQIETEKRIHRQLPKNSVVGKFFNDLPENDSAAKKQT